MRIGVRAWKITKSLCEGAVRADGQPRSKIEGINIAMKETPLVF